MVYTSGMGTALLTEEAEKMGKITIGGEFGFGASTDLDGVRWAHHGTLNVMRHNGLLTSPIEKIVPRMGGPAARRRADRYRPLRHRANAAASASRSCRSAPIVRAGTPVARLHDFDRFDEPGVDICADQDGYVLVRRFRAETNQGDVVMVIGQEVPE